MLLTAFIEPHIGIQCMAAVIHPIIDTNARRRSIEHRNIRAGSKLLVLSALCVFAVVLVKGLEISLYQDGVCRIFYGTYESSCRAGWPLAVEPLPVECSDTTVASLSPGAYFGNYERLEHGQSRICVQV